MAVDISFPVGGGLSWFFFKRLQGLNSQILEKKVDPLKTVNDSNWIVDLQYSHGQTALQ